ncbi:MAG: hypothetical protein DRQ44_15775 [Gammaproteobacteria bacterium]|nr:MAG: hypothetical protein DRQ44_15775 [Gammaproteobacteria bacterium]
MSFLKFFGISILLFFHTSATNANDSAQVQIEESPYTRCENPRPEVCNQLYQPVCGDRDTGARCIMAPCPQARKKVTYSNSCTACADKKVYGYWDGACKDSTGKNDL